MTHSDDLTGNQLLRCSLVSGAKAVIFAAIANPAIASLWAIAIYAGHLSYGASLDLAASSQYAHGKFAAIAVNSTLKLGTYCLISIVAAGFALVLTSLKRTAQILSKGLLVEGIEVDVPVILEEARLERQARAAEKHFNDGDTTAREYRVAIAQIETRRWQLRNAAKPHS